MERKSLELSEEKKDEIEPVVIMIEEVKFKSMQRAKTDGTKIVSLWGKKIPMYVAKSIFKFFDSNNDGSLNKTEWHEFLKSYGMEDYEKEFGALVDADGNGKICWQKFKNWIRRTNYFLNDGSRKSGTRFEVLVALSNKFESYDKNKKGYITIEDFIAVKNEWHYPTDTETFFKLVDKDGNNKITFNEYYHFFFHPYMETYYPNLFDDTQKCSIESLLNSREQMFKSSRFKE